MMVYYHILLVCGIASLILQVGGNESSTQNKYNNYTLIRLYPTHETQLEAAASFHDPEDQVEVLKSSHGVNDSLDLLLPLSRLSFVQDFAKDRNLKLEVKETNYGSKFESAERVARRRVLRSFSIFEYHSYNMIQDYIEKVAQRYPEVVSLETLGNSYQGRRVKLVKISADPTANNPVIFIDAGIHAREWVAPAMALYIIHRLTSRPPDRLNELNGVDWYILPVVNPDGYEHTRASKSNRLWRKTMSKSNGDCMGVDGNRNYGFKWGVSGVSNNPCDRETYAGPKPFSEIETRMVKHVMEKYADRIKLYVSLHSYGQYLVYPWGYTADVLPKSWKKLDSLARIVSDAVERAGGRPFKVLSAGKWYPAAGGSDDYAFGAIGVPYSYTMELTEGFEFVFPQDRLRLVLPQFYQGFKAFASQIKKEFRAPLRLHRRPSSSDSSDDDSL